MDIQIPVMDGISATRIIKSENISEVTVYALSTQVEANLTEMVSDIGFSGYLTKPINKDILVSLLDKI